MQWSGRLVTTAAKRHRRQLLFPKEAAGTAAHRQTDSLLACISAAACLQAELVLHHAPTSKVDLASPLQAAPGLGLRQPLLLRSLQAHRELRFDSHEARWSDPPIVDDVPSLRVLPPLPVLPPMHASLLTAGVGRARCVLAWRQAARRSCASLYLQVPSSYETC